MQQLPKLSPEQYEAMPACSSGHDHDGGETKPHGHADDVPNVHGEMPMDGMPVEGSKLHSRAAGTPSRHDLAGNHAEMKRGADLCRRCRRCADSCAAMAKMAA